MIETLEWTDTGVRFIDQTKLPTEEVYVNCTTHEQVADVIRNMVVRGAPAIGVAAAMGIALGVERSNAKTLPELRTEFESICETFARTRPTAVDLFWAIDRFKRRFEMLAAGVDHCHFAHFGGLHAQSTAGKVVHCESR